jgi:hypothetical protein
MNDKFGVSNSKPGSSAVTESQVSQAVEARLAELDQALELKVQKLDIKNGDVFVVKMTGDEFDELTVLNFKKALKGKFPKVEFIVLAMPKEHDVEFQKLAEGSKS